MRTAKAMSMDPAARPEWHGRWPKRTLAERFWARVDKGDGCWIWRGGLNKRGYGTFGIGSRQTALTHRVAWSLSYGAIPPGRLVLHSRECVARSCVRPDHLRLGDQRANVADAMALGRHHCQQGPPVWVEKPETQWLRNDPESAIRDANGRIIGRAH